MKEYRGCEKYYRRLDDGIIKPLFIRNYERNANKNKIKMFMSMVENGGKGAEDAYDIGTFEVPDVGRPKRSRSAAGSSALGVEDDLMDLRGGPLDEGPQVDIDQAADLPD